MVLYINGNYPYHSLHSELVSKLADMGNEIVVFVPLKENAIGGKYSYVHPNVEVIYAECLDLFDKFFFTHKAHKLANIIEEKIDLEKITCILAGTLYSDGVVAFFLHKKHNIPFSVAVRETDVTYHMKWRPYLNLMIKKLLSKADKVIFLSPGYKTYLEKFECDIKKIIVIPNAVNDFWFQGDQEPRTLHNPISLVYVGEISRRKNVRTTISVIAEMNNRNIKTEFHVIGEGHEEIRCHSLVKKLNLEKQVFFYGWQNGKEEIKKYYDKSDIFIMPSIRETFGTVYVEALSQGLPLIYTKGQGIDGYFEDGIVGYACDPKSTIEMADKIINIINDYRTISRNCIIKSNFFKWTLVAEEYNKVICGMEKRNEFS